METIAAWNGDDAVRSAETARLATVSRLIAAINHELNTPLGALSNSVSLFCHCLERLAPGERAALEETKQVIEGACRRIHETVSDLTEFIRPDAGGVRAVDLRESLDRAAEPFASRRIQIRREYSAIPRIDCRPLQLDRALSEILADAIDRIAGQGMITLGVRQDSQDIVVTVADTGRVLFPAELGHLFDPHLRPRQGRMTASFGLLLAHKFVHEHGGRILVSSTAGGGTTVAIRFPRHGLNTRIS